MDSFNDIDNLTIRSQSTRRSFITAACLGISLATIPRSALATTADRSPSLASLNPMRPKVLDYEAWPHLANTPNGAVLCGYTARTQHLNVEGSQAVIARTSDAGVTWNRVLQLSSADSGWGLEALGISGDARMIAIASVNSQLSHDKPERFEVYSSSDDGITFARLSTIEPGEDFSIATIGSLSLTPSNDLIAPWHGDGWGVIVSTDGGSTWEIIGGANGGKWPIEGRVFVASDMSLLMIGRNFEDDFGLLLLRSTDEGRSWTRAQPTGLGVVFEGIYVEGDAVFAALVNRESGDISWTTTTTTRLLADSSDWDEPVVVGALDPSGAPAEQGYPEMAKLDDSTLILAAYDGVNPKTDIRFWRVENI